MAELWAQVFWRGICSILGFAGGDNMPFIHEATAKTFVPKELFLGAQSIGVIKWGGMNMALCTPKLYMLQNSGC